MAERSQCAPDYCPTSVYEPQDCLGVSQKRTNSDQQCVVYNFKCDQCDARYVGNTRGHLFVHVDGHRSKTSSLRKHYDSRHAGRIPDDLHSCFNVLKKCQVDCLVNEMLLIKQLRPCLNVQSDSICAKVFL